MIDFAHWDEADWRDFYQERAAILEYDGGFSRRTAEELARREVWALRGRGKQE